MSSAADRQRCYRERRASGQIVVPVVVDDVAVPEALCAAGFLAADRKDDRAAIGVAIERVLAALVHGGDA